jgi:hypothetical protein
VTIFNERKQEMTGPIETHRRAQSDEIVEDESEQNAPLVLREQHTNDLLALHVLEMAPEQETELRENGSEEIVVAETTAETHDLADMRQQSETIPGYVAEEIESGELAESENSYHAREDQQLAPSGPITQDLAEKPAPEQQQDLEIGDHNTAVHTQTHTQQDHRPLLEIAEFEPAKLEPLNAITSAQHSAIEPLENVPADLQLTNTPTDEALTVWKTGAYEGVDGFYYDDSLKEDLAEVAEGHENSIGISL